MGIILGVLAIILMLIPGMGLIAAIIGLFGYFKSKKAFQESKKWSILGMILSALPILYALFAVFILLLALTSK